MNVLSRLKQVVSVSTVILCISTASMSQATAAERYIVSGVESWDTLNIRSEPSARSTIIGEIPSNGSGVNSNGTEFVKGRTTWVKVNWNGINGWVSKRYLATDYSYTAPTPKPVVKKPVYMPTPDYSAQGSTITRKGSIYDAGNSTVRSVYAGPGNGLPAIKHKQSTAPYVAKSNNASTAHTHPANRCTRSVSHSHPNGANQHTHRYSCQGQATPAPQVQVKAPANANTHTHPRNQLTNAVTHTHASGNVQHQHNYGGQAAQQVTMQQPAVSQSQPLITHIHPASPYNKQTQHTHAGGAGVHIHDFLMPPKSAVKPAVAVSANSHTHPKNQFTNSVTHTHPNGANQHTHSYGGQR